MTGNSVFSFEVGHATDTGCVRDHNEDSYLTRPDFGLWVVADGMGGHAAGDFASQTITGMAETVGVASSAQDLQARFMERLTRANSMIRDHAVTLGGATVGATLVAMLAFEEAYACIWSGDSRIYLMRNGVLTQQTTDHTEVQALLEAGTITPDEATDWPRKNVITRAIGVTDEPNCDIVSGVLQAGDVFLLCSDGLTEHLTDTDISRILTAGPAQGICDALIGETLARGAKDNTTAIVIRCQPRHPEAMENGQ